HRGVGQAQQADRAGGGERDRHQQDERLDQAAERRHHDQEDDGGGGEHGQAELLEGLVLLGADAGDLVADPGGQRQLLQRVGQLGADPAEVGDLGGAGDPGGALAVGAGDLLRALDAFDVGDLGELDHAGGGGQGQVADLLEVLGGLAGAQDDVAGAAVEVDAAEGGAAERLGDDLADLGLGEAVAGGLAAVHLDLDALAAVLEVVGDVADALDAGPGVGDRGRGGLEHVHVGALDDDLELVDVEAALIAAADGDGADAVELGEAVAQGLLDLGAVGVLLQADRVGGPVGGAGAEGEGAGGADVDLVGGDAVDLGQDLLHLLGGLVGGGQVGAGGHALAHLEGVLAAGVDEV